MKRIQMTVPALIFILLGWISSAHATSILFTDQSAWRADVLSSGYNITTIDFENVTTSPDLLTVTAGDVIFSSTWSLANITHNTGKALSNTVNQPIEIDLPGGVYAFGFDFGEVEPVLGHNSTVTISNLELSTGEFFSGPYGGNPYPTFSFFGICSNDLPITSLSIWPRAILQPILDNFVYAQEAVPAPEPASLLLLSFGILGLVASVWRNRLE